MAQKVERWLSNDGSTHEMEEAALAADDLLLVQTGVIGSLRTPELEAGFDSRTPDRPRPEDFGYEGMDGYGESGNGGWQLEGGEEAYGAALAAWEKVVGPEPYFPDWFPGDQA